MSKLADKIRKATHAEPGPIGFGAVAADKAAPTLLCLVRLAGGQAKEAAQAAAGAADAFILDGADVSHLSGLAEKLGDATLGVRCTKADRATTAKAREAGADFVVIDSESAAESILEEKLGYVFVTPHEVSDIVLRVMETLPLDALLVPPPDGSFTLRRLLDLRRLSLFTRAPLLMEVPPDAGAPHLQALREAGVVGVILDGRHLGRLAALRAMLESLPPRGRRREERAEAILPAAVASVAAEEEEEEDYP